MCFDINSRAADIAKLILILYYLAIIQDDNRYNIYIQFSIQY